MNSSPIVKCSHCKQVLSSKDFGTHECDIPINDSKIIEVAYFRDDSYKDKKLMTGMGLDGVLYTFEVVPRKPLPFILPLSDDGYHGKKSDDKLPEPIQPIYKGGLVTQRTAKELIETEWKIIDKLQNLAEKTPYDKQKAFYYQTLASHIRTLSMLLKLHGQPNQTVTATLHQQHVSENPRIAITQLKPCLKI